MTNRRLTFTLLALLLFACSMPAQAPTDKKKPADKPLRVLFVGNSYTYENNLPFVFEALATPLRPVQVTMLAAGGATLRRHIDDGRLLKMIREGGYDAVVAQEHSLLGPMRLFDGSTLINEPAAYQRAVREIAKATRAAGGRLVLFSTWPRAETPKNLAALHNPSIEIAKEVGATVAPVGLIWDRLGGDACQTVKLYAEDGSHPAAEGTYVAAVVLIRAILGKTPELKPVRKVPLMDGAAKPDGSFVDITPNPRSIAAIDQVVSAAFGEAKHGQFAALADIPAISAPVMPPDNVRGRISSSFFRGEWQGEFATFGGAYHATLKLDLRGEKASIQLIHPEGGWPGNENVTTELRGPDAAGVITLTYSSKGKDCTVEIKLVRVGDQLRGTVRFVLAGDKEWVRSSLALVRK